MGSSHVDRIERHVMQQRNHVSIVMWSLGNESDSDAISVKLLLNGAGQLDPSRPVHYEEDRFGESVDAVDHVSRVSPDERLRASG